MQTNKIGSKKILKDICSLETFSNFRDNVDVDFNDHGLKKVKMEVHRMLWKI